MSDKIAELKDDDFKETIGSGTVLVDFWAPWCGPCKAQGPALEKLANENDGKYKIAKVNVDDAPNTASEYGIMSIPTLLVFKDGKEVKRFSGLQKEDTLKEALDSV